MYYSCKFHVYHINSSTICVISCSHSQRDKRGTTVRVSVSAGIGACSSQQTSNLNMLVATEPAKQKHDLSLTLTKCFLRVFLDSLSNVNSKDFCKSQILPRLTFVPTVAYHVLIMCLLATYHNRTWSCDRREKENSASTTIKLQHKETFSLSFSVVLRQRLFFAISRVFAW